MTNEKRGGSDYRQGRQARYRRSKSQEPFWRTQLFQIDEDEARNQQNNKLSGSKFFADTNLLLNLNLPKYILNT